MHVMVFDIETVPDTEAGRRLWDMEGIDDAGVAKALGAQRGARARDFLPLHLHRVVAISVVYATPGRLKIFSLGEIDTGEAEIVDSFFRAIEKTTPVLVSWNGGGFDLPVLHYRALRHGLSAPRYWDSGDDDRDFRFNNYLNRYHRRHIDLMDVLASYNSRAWVSLQDAATLIGLPGKQGMDGGDVWRQYQDGKLAAIRDYCEIDVLNTYLLYLRWCLLCGHLTHDQWHEQCDRVRGCLEEQDRPHFREFLQAWQVAS